MESTIIRVVSCAITVGFLFLKWFCVVTQGVVVKQRFKTFLGKTKRFLRYSCNDILRKNKEIPTISYNQQRETKRNKEIPTITRETKRFLRCSYHHSLLEDNNEKQRETKRLNKEKRGETKRNNEKFDWTEFYLFLLIETTRNKENQRDT